MHNFFPNHDVEEAVEVYRSFQTKTYKELVQMFPGMRELVLELKEKGYKLAIVTSRLRPTTMDGLEKFGLVETFDYVTTADDTDKHKPDPEPAMIALNRLGSTPQEAILVGDTMFDMGCGKNAGMKTVIVGWAMATDAQAEINEYTPDYRIKKAEDLWDVLAELDAE